MARPTTKARTRQRWQEVVRLKVRGEGGRVPGDEETAQRTGYQPRTLQALLRRREMAEMLRAEEEQVREEIRRTAAARLLWALRNPGEKDDPTKLALTVWDKSRRDGEENGCGCETNGCGEAEARLEKFTDRDLAALAALASAGEPGGAAGAGEDGA